MEASAVIPILITDDYNPAERRGNIKVDDVFGGGAKGEKADKLKKPISSGSMMQKPSLIKPEAKTADKSKAKPTNVSTASDDKLEVIRALVSINENPELTLHKIRELLGVAWTSKMDVESQNMELEGEMPQDDEEVELQ